MAYTISSPVHPGVALTLAVSLLAIAVVAAYVFGRSSVSCPTECSSVLCPEGQTLDKSGCITVASKYCAKGMFYNDDAKTCESLSKPGYCPVGTTLTNSSALVHAI